MINYRLPEPVFVPQFDPAEDVERRIAKREQEDMNDPEWNWCGICCVRMILLGLGKEAPPIEEMYRTAFDDYGVFKMVDGAVIGAYHKELARYIERGCGLAAYAKRGMSANDVADMINGGWYIIASVSASIREPDGEVPEKKGGHLVLVHRVEKTNSNQAFIIHNSTGFVSTDTQRNVPIPEARFAECFSGCAILVREHFSPETDT
jgi:hypothetical protein